ncbi:hypothetical protein K3495_g13694, partial [Podosphaera aphanis]
TSTQLETPQQPLESFTPFESLNFDEFEENLDDECLRGDCRSPSEEENSERCQETTGVRRRRPPGSKNKVHEKVTRNTKSAAANSSASENETVASQSFLIASESVFTVDERTDPQSRVEAMSRNNSRKWRVAIDAEYRSLAAKQT